jgi:hypothetical protein
MVVDRVGDQPPHHHIRAAQQLAQHRGRDRAVAAQLGGMGIGPGQRRRADGDIDPHRQIVGLRQAGDPLHQGVAHQMPQTARIAVGLQPPSMIV